MYFGSRRERCLREFHHHLIPPPVLEGQGISCGAAPGDEVQLQRFEEGEDPIGQRGHQDVLMRAVTHTGPVPVLRSIFQVLLPRHGGFPGIQHLQHLCHSIVCGATEVQRVTPCRTVCVEHEEPFAAFVDLDVLPQPWQVSQGEKQTHLRPRNARDKEAQSVDAVEGVLADDGQKVIFQAEVTGQRVQDQLLLVGATLQASELCQQTYHLSECELWPQQGEVSIQVDRGQGPWTAKAAV
mmetsp:Transcript_87680/g.179121  ORF Transcript_87680/g.179121 Transcript_87680/m.179121 type:complete len:239 (+) Transcript_87680:1248-1964(+)